MYFNKFFGYVRLIHVLLTFIDYLICHAFKKSNELE
jgi:hypothetical protein